jgi:hypothetical protein
MTQPQIAVDNDVVLKVASYGLSSIVWPEGGREIGVLVAARFVVASAIARGRGRDKARAQTELERLLESASPLEPTPAEIEAALTLELAAQRARLPLDPGESQLCAIVVARAMTFLQTGDKRAVRSLELLLADVEELAELCGRVLSLEQAMLGAVANEDTFQTTAAALCAEPDLDKALSICFGCYGSPAAREEVTERLGMYIKDLRAGAPRILAPN